MYVLLRETGDLGRLKPFLKQENEAVSGRLSEVSLSGFFWDMRTEGSIAGGMSHWGWMCDHVNYMLCWIEWRENPQRHEYFLLLTQSFVYVWLSIRLKDSQSNCLKMHVNLALLLQVTTFPDSKVCNAHIYVSTFRYVGWISNTTLFHVCM